MTPKDFFYHPTLCPIPWNGVYIEPDGRVNTCAVAQESLGNIKDTPIQDILTGKVNRSIKLHQINKQKPKNCHYCYRVDDLSQDVSTSQSNRSWYKKMCAESVHTGLFDSVDNFKLEILDLRWRNTCNLACGYCSPNLSSRWAQEMQSYPLMPADDQIEQTKAWIYDQLSNIKHVYLAGGEPLLIKDNLDLLERVQQVNPGIDLRVNTNLINIDTPVYRKILEFPKVKWTVSVENIKDKFYYTRYPGDWAKFESNLDQLISTGADVNFNMTWSLLGAPDILDCIQYFLDRGFHENMFVVNVLDDPFYLDVRNLSNEFLDGMRNRIQQLMSSTNPSYWLHKSLGAMYNFSKQSFSKKDPARSLLFFSGLDMRRNLDFSKTFPDTYLDLINQTT